MSAPWRQAGCEERGHLKSPVEPMVSELQEQSYCIYRSSHIAYTVLLHYFLSWPYILHKVQSNSAAGSSCAMRSCGRDLSPHSRWGLRALPLSQIADPLSSGKEAPGIRHTSMLTWSCELPSLWREASVIFHCI